MKSKTLILVAGMFTLLLTFSCKKDKVSTGIVNSDCADTISFSATVLPLITQNCSTSGCHDANSGSAGYTLTSHQDISPSASQVLGAMRHDAGFAPMPEGAPKLADSLIQYVECWISQGKLNN